MKKTVGILLLVQVLISSFHKPLIIGFYELNKAYVIENLCVNKNNPEKHCEGKCFINDQTSEDEHTADQIIHQLLKSLKEEPFFHTYTLNIAPESSVEDSFHPNTSDLLPQNYIISIFHPPKI